MSGQHTPGPWAVDVWQRDNILVRAASGKVVADLYFLHDNSPEDAANGRLIAAAPELLEALVQARNLLVSAERHHAGAFQKRIRSAYIKSSAAITKATATTTDSEVTV